MEKDWVNFLKNKRDEILEDGKKIFIVNAGRMNHGKSSLFNSLLNKPIFAVDDIRTTMTRQDADFSQDVVMVDTPGLDADSSDDKVAFDAYRRANLIVFVHTVKTGAVERDDIDSLNRMAKEAVSPEYFWRHFVLVFSNIDEYDADDAEDSKKMRIIEEESLRNIKSGCGEHDFPIFRVSNTYFQDGNEANSEQLIAMSGIRELKEYILAHLDAWRQEQTQLMEQRFSQAKREIMEAIQGERKTVADTMAAKAGRFLDWEKSVKEKLDKFQAEIEDTHNAWCEAKAEQNRWEPLYRLDSDAKSIFKSANLTRINSVYMPLIDPPSFNEDGFSSRDSAKSRLDKLRESYAEKYNWYFAPRRGSSICEILGKAYSEQIFECFSGIKTKLENAIRQAGKTDILNAGISIGTEVYMGGDEVSFYFDLDGKSLCYGKDWREGAYEEHFDRFITRFRGKVHRSGIDWSIDSYNVYESGWFGGEKKVRKYSFSLYDGQTAFNEAVDSACEFLYEAANLDELHRQIMDGLERSFQQEVIQKLANRTGTDVSVSSAYDSKRRQAERLQSELQSNFRECLDGLCALENVSDLPTVQDAQKRPSYYCENMGDLVSGVKDDIDERTLVEFADEREEIIRNDKVAAEIETMQLDG
ncbi:GTPase [Selenomonas sp.]|uniref:GTPase n=1 Tax=Selenomonas sp. TaxID=2053611 RepID=UPI003FA2A646